MKKTMGSTWTVAGLAHCLREYRRIDDGTDNLSLSIEGDFPHRSVYIYLYGEDPDLIHYDLEDMSIDNGSWDHAVRRGSARSIEELRWIINDWVRPETKELEPVGSGDYISELYTPMPYESDR